MIPLYGQQREVTVTSPSLSSPDPAEIRLVAFCELVANPELYENHIIRLRATYLQTYHFGWLYDLECSSMDNIVKAHLDCSATESCEELRTRLSSSLPDNDPIDGGGRAELVIIGRFNVYQRVGRRPRGAQTDKVYIFSIRRIEQAIPIPAERPWPSWYTDNN